jgi:LysR family hydrogen peroxide-inducible transcriptional activator
VNLRDLEYLVAVADHRHFGDAAAACFVSQPTLSTQIKKLETELGVELIERTPRAIHLSAVGERVVDTARKILAGTHEIQGLAQAARDPEAGSLRLGIFPTLAPYLLPHVVPLLHQRFPRLELLLREEKSPVLVDEVREGRLDVALMAQPQRSDLTEVPLFREEFLLALPTGHPLGRRERVAVSDLEGEDVLLLDEGHCLRDQALSVCHLAGARERRGFRATSLETLRQMVVAGVGITLLPRLALSTDPGSSLVVREFSAPVPRRDIALYWRPRHPAAAFFERFADVLRDALPPGVEVRRPTPS